LKFNVGLGPIKTVAKVNSNKPKPTRNYKCKLHRAKEKTKRERYFLTIRKQRRRAQILKSNQKILQEHA